jgi:hypothetical protein
MQGNYQFCHKKHKYLATADLQDQQGSQRGVGVIGKGPCGSKIIQMELVNEN